MKFLIVEPSPLPILSPQPFILENELFFSSSPIEGITLGAGDWGRGVDKVAGEANVIGVYGIIYISNLVYVKEG